MTPDPRPELLVKICGLTRKEDARAADEAGADFLGVVLSDGFGRSVPLDAAPAVVAGTRARRVAVLVDETPEDAACRGEAIDASVLQLHGGESRHVVESLRDLGDWTLWKAVRAHEIDDIRRVVDEMGDVIDGLLIEGWREGAVGGAGLRLSLDSDAVCEALPVSLTFVLAGGLAPDVVRGAVARFGPDVVDVSSGVEQSPGIKDHTLVHEFIRMARAASASRRRRSL